MKKKYFIVAVVLTSIIAGVIYSCNEDSKESCLQDEICDITVTACCDDNDVCTYKYNGKDYPEDQYDQLLEDMGCPSASAGKISEKNNLIFQLKTLILRAREQ